MGYLTDIRIINTVAALYNVSALRSCLKGALPCTYQNHSDDAESYSYSTKAK